MWKSKAYRSYYDILNLQKDCTAEDIHKSYIKLCKLYHPDKNLGKEYSHDEFVSVKEAYTTLKNPDKRRLYDYYLSNNYYKKFKKYDAYYKTHGYRVDLDDTCWDSDGNFRDSYFFRLILMPKFLLITYGVIILFLVGGEHMVMSKNNGGTRMGRNDDSFMLSLIFENAVKERRLLGMEEQMRRLTNGTLGVDPRKLLDEYYENNPEDHKRK